MKTRIVLDVAAKEGLHTYGIPPHMHNEIIAYINEGYPPGGFLNAVLENDLKMAGARADPTNAVALHNYVKWLFAFAPLTSWGHQGAVKEWMKTKR